MQNSKTGKRFDLTARKRVVLDRFGKRQRTARLRDTLTRILIRRGKLEEIGNIKPTPQNLLRCASERGIEMDTYLRLAAVIVLTYMALVVSFNRYLLPNCRNGFVAVSVIGQHSVCVAGYRP